MEAVSSEYENIARIQKKIVIRIFVIILILLKIRCVSPASHDKIFPPNLNYNENIIKILKKHFYLCRI